MEKSDFNADVFGSKEMLQPAPVDKIPAKGTRPDIAYQMVKDETFAQTQPRLNMATFVTTYMDKHATKLMNEAIALNYIDETEYPRVAVMCAKCINILANLWNTPEQNQWTHDHLDHIRHLGSFCKRLHKPVYTTSVIHHALARHTFTAPTIGPYRNVLKENEWNEVAGMKVRFFVVPHDATQTVGYAIEVGGRKFVIMTDVGRMTDEAVEYARQADTVVIESNYDMDMLLQGPYTYELKMRIVQGCGHLSNDECASAIKRFWHPGLKNIFLCHLSENNNTHELAYQASLEALNSLGVEKGTVALRCLPRQHPSQMFTL